MQAGVAYAPDGAIHSGMGSDFRDVNNDGRPDIWHTAVEREIVSPVPESGERRFRRLHRPAASHTTRDMAGWSNGIVDLDNDGWKDLFIVRGNVQDNI